MGKESAALPKRSRTVRRTSPLGRCDGRGGSGGGARPAVPGGGGSTQHVWLKMIPALC